jgi:hypothetical protein
MHLEVRNNYFLMISTERMVITYNVVCQCQCIEHHTVQACSYTAVVKEQLCKQQPV